jgi:hypothetical protein
MKMKTYKNLFAAIVSFENLYTAAKNAAQGKREKFGVMMFFMKLEENLFQLQSELSMQSYCPGAYRSFFIYDPKPRMISAAPFRDRVVHLRKWQKHPPENIDQRVASWLGHARQADTKALIRKLKKQNAVHQ